VRPPAWLDEVGPRFARVAARVVVFRPVLWRFFRGPLRFQFDRLARGWDSRRDSLWLAPLVAALERLDGEPAQALDIGTGTGAAARLLGDRHLECEVVGVDLSPDMIDEARRLLPPRLSGRVRFEVADASALPYGDATFDLVVLLNMIPFFEELARVTAPGGTLVVAHSLGPDTPFWTPAETLRARLAARGFGGFEEFAAGDGTALLARKGDGG
jgi:ubiquinone/menaquinone biosynthesis C-methylase UbiE